MLIKLDDSQKALLLDVLKGRSFGTLISESPHQYELTHDQRRELCELLGLELSASGLGVHDEPNERGFLIESLIDRLKPWQE